MKTRSARLLRRSLFACICLAALLPSLAHAQATKIFVASFGNDANDGSRGSPKRNFQAAHDTVATGGQIVVLDTAGFGSLNITKSLSVTVPPGVNGFVTVTGTSSAIYINAAATDVVALRGLVIEGGGATAGGIGIYVPAVGTLTVEDCTVRGFTSGIFIGTYSSTHLLVRGGSVRDVSDGIIVEAFSSNIVVDAIITGCTLDNASDAAVEVLASGSGDTATATVKDCVLAHSLAAMKTTSVGSVIVADNCVVSDNTYGFYKSSNQGTCYTRGNNTFSLNANNINAPNTTTSFGGF